MSLKQLTNLEQYSNLGGDSILCYIKENLVIQNQM